MRSGRLFLWGATLLALGALPGVAQDPKPMDSHPFSWCANIRGSWHHFWDTCEMHRQRVNAWPEPFQSADGELVRGPFRTMADNGWRLENTLGDELFDRETQELTYAGRVKLHGLMTQFPPHRREVFVLEAAKPENTGKRLAAVQRYLMEIAPEQTCNVWTTKIAPPVLNGRYAQRAFRGYLANDRAADHFTGSAGDSAPLGAGTPLGPGPSSGNGGGSHGQ